MPTSSCPPEVSIAMQSLEQGIHRVYRRYERRKQQAPPSHTKASIQKILQHMQYCLSEMHHNIHSLQNGLDYLQNTFWPTILKQYNNNNNNYNTLNHWKPALQQVFQHLLRLHDGLILIISGECRHQGDLPTTTHLSSFPSKLPQCQSLYSNKAVYSGASWDEFMNQQVGLQTRLLQALRPLVTTTTKVHALWDTLSEPGMEFLLVRMETTIQTIQQQFVECVRVITHSLQHLCSAVELSMKDKMETFHVTMGTQTCHFERRGSTFQIQDARGVLPKGFGTNEWAQIMTVPRAAINKKPRRVIQESDDEEPSNNNSSGGLIVKIQSKANAPVREGISVNEIKQKMGVDVDGLAASREVLEAEEDLARQDAMEVDHTAQEEEMCRVARYKVKCLQRVLRKALTREERDEYEVWDAREGLREALMTAGNQLLWSSALLSQANSDREMELQRAIEYFADAQALVVEQKELHTKTCQSTMTDIEARFFYRNLELLHGQAMVNKGIALIELAKIAEGHYLKAYLRQASLQLDKGYESASQLASLALDATPSEEATMDLLRAKQLESLSFRWKAVALWIHGRKDESQTWFEKAALVSDQPEIRTIAMTEIKDLFEVYMEVCVESYYAWITLADLSAMALEKISSRQKKEGDELLDVASRAFEKAATSSGDIRTRIEKSFFSKSMEDFCVQNDVKETDELRSCLQDLIYWWSDRKTLRSDPIDSTNVKAFNQRSDLVGGEYHRESLPTRVMTITDKTRRRKNKWLGGGAGLNNASSTGITATSSTTFKRQTTVYRKWGDELLPQVRDEHGRLVPKLVYPTIAPEMPPEIAAIVKTFKHRS